MAMKPMQIPIKRNRDRGGIDLCIPAAIKWLLGLVTLAFPAATGLLWSLALNVQVVANDTAAIKDDIHELDDKLDRVRTDPFTGTDGKELREEMLQEIRRRHGGS